MVSIWNLMESNSTNTSKHVQTYDKKLSHSAVLLSEYGHSLYKNFFL